MNRPTAPLWKLTSLLLVGAAVCELVGIAHRPLLLLGTVLAMVTGFLELQIWKLRRRGLLRDPEQTRRFRRH